MDEKGKTLILERLKEKLNITWKDERTDSKLKNIIDDAELIVNHKLGAEVDYSAPENAIGRVLFLNYCMYVWNDCTEDFDKAYLSEIQIARGFYEVKENEEKEENSGTE